VTHSAYLNSGRKINIKFPHVDADSCFIPLGFHAVCSVDKKNYLLKNCVSETYYNIEDNTAYCYIEIMVKFVWGMYVACRKHEN
jgi:hypothetical protein